MRGRDIVRLRQSNRAAGIKIGEKIHVYVGRGR